MADAAYKACIDWLTRCSMLPKDHWLSSGNGCLSDLAHLLKDGVLLCHLLNRLCPSAIDPKDFSQRPQMSQFLCLKNSRAFLAACKTVFKMRDDDLFEPGTFYNPASYGKILHLLSVLSKTPVAQRSGIAPFSINETYYTNMKAFDDHRNGSFDDDDDDDDVYNDYYSVGMRNCDDDEEKIYGSVFENNSKKDTQPKTKRDMCINELVETEKKYVDVLNSLRTHFMKPLRERKDLLPSHEFEKIFLGIEKLWAIHTDFKASLLKAMDRDSATSIPDCFVTCKEKFLFYGEYCANLTLAQETIDKLCQNNPALQTRVQELEIIANEGKFRMRDLLSIPMQRVLKYHLLLKELIRHTKEDDPERKMLEKALDETQDLSLFVNEVKRDRETLSAISQISASIIDLPKNTCLEEYGRPLIDGEMKVKMSTENSAQSRHIFIFDKIILICKSMKGDVYSYKSALVLEYYDLHPGIGKEKGQYSILLSERTGKDTCTYMILAKKEEQVKKWAEVIRLAKDNEKPLFSETGNHEFKMHTFDKATICDVCRKLLRGVFFQGYQCSKTKMNVHKECLKAAKDMEGPPTRNTLPPKRTASTCTKSPKSTFKTMKTMVPYSGLPPPGSGRPPLCFDARESVQIISDMDPEWLEGELNGKRGFFPRSAVWDQWAPVSPISAAPPSLKARRSSSDYMNEEMELTAFHWYAGTLSRDVAINKLNPLPNGSYLIRISDRPGNRGEFAISIKSEDKVMHMKVMRDDEGKFFLGASKKFDTLPLLVEFYQQISLERVYPELKTVLDIPYKNAKRPGRKVIGSCTAMYDYSATEPSQLSLRKDEVITILSKAEESKGWWKGESRSGKVGQFPVIYVRENTE